jgi:hypothetical protein
MTVCIRQFAVMGISIESFIFLAFRLRLQLQSASGSGPQTSNTEYFDSNLVQGTDHIT